MRPRPFTSAYVIVGIIVAVLFVMSIFDPPYRNLFAPSNWWEYLGFLSIMVSVIVLGGLSDRERRNRSRNPHWSAHLREVISQRIKQEGERNLAEALVLN